MPDDFPNHTALVVCAECHNHRYYAPVFAVEFKGPEEEHLVTCEFHGEIPAVVLVVVPTPEVLR
jgi:hypothetical protein